ARRLPLLGLAALAAFPVSAADYRPPRRDLGFPVYTNAPAGRQMAGQHAAATTPAMSPEDARKAFVVPPGFQVRLFASEPEVVNPVAMSFDERGRLWVLELYEYPLGTKPGEKGRDRIKILEDTDADGRADTVKVWADGMTLATGLVLGNGGAYVGEAPNLWFLQDTDGDGRADKKTALLTGFGLEDRHELLNGFTWGPDGQLYMTHGVFTVTKAVNPDAPDAEPVVLTAGVARLDPKSRRFEVFAEGTSNPWGVDFDATGQAFVSACVIDHLFHLAPGGLYQRQAGQAPFPYAYEDLPSIVDHKHHMAAYAGIQIVQGDQWPATWRGAALHGNIHQNALNIDRLTPRGSSYVASRWNESGDFLTTPDGWFMPVSIQTGPDGAVWVMDWYDKYPCYQNANADPAGVDREHGRIWRVVWTGEDGQKPVPSRPAKDMDLAKLPSADLVKLLAHPNVWQRRTAQRLLAERRDAATAAPLHALFTGGPNLDARLAALWTLFAAGFLDDARIALAAADREPAVRAWAARFVGEQRVASEDRFGLLARLAADADPTVRSAVATACRQFVSGQLTVNTPPPPGVSPEELGPVLGALIEASHAGDDRTINFLTWMAAEPLVVAAPETALAWLAENGAEFLPLSGTITTKALRRLCDTREPANLDLALEFLDRLSASAPLARHAFDGLIAGQRGKAVTPARDAGPVLAKFLASPDAEIASRAQQLGALWGDAAAVKASLARINDASASEADRLAAIRTARRLKTDDTRDALLAVVNGAASDALKVEAVRGLTDVGVDDTARQLLEGWGGYPPAVRAAVAELVTTRGNWKWPFYEAVERGDIKRGDLPPTVIRALATAQNQHERDKAVQIFGKVQASSAEKLKLIADKRKVVVSGPVDLAAGHEVAKKACFICHALHGEGANIGPDLTGVGRSSLDALLHNVIHPNEIIGAGYEQVEVETKDDQTLSGRMTENTATSVKLVMAGPTEAVVDKSNVKSLRVTGNSAMPEGLEQMPDADFRNMIWYILAPPQEGPLTDQRRRELIGGSGDRADTSEGRAPRAATDGESIALWNPEWRVECPDFEGAPAKLPEFAGERNVLMTHPVGEHTPAALVRKLTLPAGQRAVLRFKVAAHEQGDWRLRVLADGEVLHEQAVTHDGQRWHDVKLDVTPLAGRMVVLRLENAASGWNWEFGYWAALRIEEGEVAAR
ncbi:MAG: PVC-type heme-binding CxxCH protein, partial [Limisphaerales bacterium]